MRAHLAVSSSRLIVTFRTASRYHDFREQCESSHANDGNTEHLASSGRPERVLIASPASWDSAIPHQPASTRADPHAGRWRVPDRRRTGSPCCGTTCRSGRRPRRRRSRIVTSGPTIRQTAVTLTQPRSKRNHVRVIRGACQYASVQPRSRIGHSAGHSYTPCGTAASAVVRSLAVVKSLVKERTRCSKWKADGALCWRMIGLGLDDGRKPPGQISFHD